MAAEMQVDILEEILAKVTVLQEHQAVLIEKQNTSIAFTNSAKDFTIGLQMFDAKMEYRSRYQHLATATQSQSHSPINSEFSLPGHNNFPAHKNQFHP